MRQVRGPTVMWNRPVLHVSLCGGSKGHAAPLTNNGGRGLVLQRMRERQVHLDRDFEMRASNLCALEVRSQ